MGFDYYMNASNVMPKTHSFQALVLILSVMFVKFELISCFVQLRFGYID